MAPSHTGVHCPMLLRNIEIDRIRNVDRFQKLDPRAFIGNIANTPILTYRTLDEALGRIAATPHPLAAFIFSRDKAAIDRFIGELSFGGGAVNQVNIHLFIETMPFGGVGPSGMGQYYGKY